MKSNEAKSEFEDIKKNFFFDFKKNISATDSQYPKTHIHQKLAPKNNIMERYYILHFCFFPNISRKFCQTNYPTQ